MDYWGLTEQNFTSQEQLTMATTSTLPPPLEEDAAYFEKSAPRLYRLDPARTGGLSGEGVSNIQIDGFLAELGTKAISSMEEIEQRLCGYYPCPFGGPFGNGGLLG
tara:strand:+ start:355 stop:672 length:318 start_codon:yes stop_codon:yes gene_type:complete